MIRTRPLRRGTARASCSPPATTACTVEIVTWWRSLAALLCIVTALVSSQDASASSGVQAENRVGGFDLVAPTLVGLHALRGAEKHWENSLAYDENAPGYTLPAEGAGGGMAAIRQLGTESELASGIVKNTERIASASNPGSYRIPDMLDHGAQIIGEVKNVGRLSYTSQLRDFASYAQANGYDFHLWVRSTTQLSGPLSAEVANGNIILNFLP